MRWLFLLLAFLPMQRMTELPLTPIGFDGKEFKQAFNNQASNPRLVMVFSPT